MLIIPPQMYSKITQLCNLVNKTEWSALLFFKADGHPINPDTFKCTLVDLFLQDVGTPGFTAFKNDVDTMMDLYEKHPEYMECRMGIIHSHHNMETFYSGTDMSELYDNSDGVDFYLSVVINNRAEWIAKVVYQVKEIQTKLSWREDGELKESCSKESAKVIHNFVDLNIMIGLPDPELGLRVKQLIEINNKKEEDKKKLLPIKGELSSLYKKYNTYSQSDEDFEKWRSGKKIANHVSPRQRELFDDKTLQEVYQDEINKGLGDLLQEDDVVLEDDIFKMVDIAKACISIQPDENREMFVIASQIRREISDEEANIYVDEVLDNIDQIYSHWTSTEITEASRASLYREMLALSEDRKCTALDLLAKELKREIKLIKN